MSADQRAWLVTGVVRRLLLRAALVLGGAFAVTLSGWLLCATSAHADVLPSVPSVPSVPTVPATPVAPSLTSTDVTAVPRKWLDDLSTSDVTAVGRHGHIAVTDTGQWAADPSVVVPAAEVLSRGGLVPPATKAGPAGGQQATHRSAHPAARVSPTPSRSRRSFAAVVQRQHMRADAAPVHRAGSTPSPLDAGHHSPALPPLQPAGSSDSSVHGGGGVAGGSGGVQIPFAHQLGNGFIMSGRASTPRLAAGPGRRPGTSPD